jgi:predicted MFS family arabinose efflux permease
MTAGSALGAPVAGLAIDQWGWRGGFVSVSLIGLAVSRAKAMEDIASALPASDPRVSEYRRIANLQARGGMAAMYEADYVGTHWIGTYLVDYMLSAAHTQLSTRAP